MQNYILFDDASWNNLLPLTYTRPVAEIRTGILTIREKWEHFLAARCSHYTQPYLQEKYPAVTGGENILINGSVLPDEFLAESVKQLKPGEAIVYSGVVVAAGGGSELAAGITSDLLSAMKKKEYTASELIKINYAWDIFKYNGAAIEKDFSVLIQNRTSAMLSSTNNLIAAENIFVEEGVKAEYVTINASDGPVYIARDSEIMEGCLIRGPFALGEHSVMKLGAKVYGPTTIGPECRIGGEVNNAVILGFSNKGHDGFLGNAVIGEWCNLGADTNNSNLKNTYDEVKMWHEETGSFIKTGLQFCGLVMSDHSKCGINTMFNTGTTVGVCANIFGSGFPRVYIPSFSWGGAQGYETYKLDKAFKTMEEVMKRRGCELTETDKKIIEHIFDTTNKHRNFK